MALYFSANLKYATKDQVLLTRSHLPGYILRHILHFIIEKKYNIYALLYLTVSLKYTTDFSNI